MKELQLLAELMNLATQKGAFDMNQVAAGLEALKQLSNILTPEANEQPAEKNGKTRKLKAEKESV